jgi:hypothetical protein
MQIRSRSNQKTQILHFVFGLVFVWSSSLLVNFSLRKMKFLLVLVLFAGLLESVHALQCYGCVWSSDGYMSDSESYTENCKSGGDKIQQVTCKEDYVGCAAAYGNAMDYKEGKRKCINRARLILCFLGGDVVVRGCDDGKFPHAEMKILELNQCKTDLCNGAPLFGNAFMNEIN